MATALCDLQLELKCSSGTGNFQLRTPPIREHKRKHSKNQNVRVKLETKLNDLERQVLTQLVHYSGLETCFLHVDTKLSSKKMCLAESNAIVLGDF